LSCHRDNTTKASAINSTYGKYPPQVVGHGKLNNTVNCSVCHGHQAADMTFTSDCRDCHQNASAGSYPVESGSNVTPPQVVGHGQVNCTECHGHTLSQFAGVTPVTECSGCHQNSSTGTYGRWDGSNTTPPQTAGHGRANCSMCHSHQENMTYLGNSTSECLKCHKWQNITAQDLVDYDINSSWENKSWADYVNTTYEPHVPPIVVTGHGNASGRGEVDCTYCHGHTPYNFSTMTVRDNCTECHLNNNSGEQVPITNGTYVSPLQVQLHGDLNCTTCHSHNASRLIYKDDCLECHAGKSHGRLDTKDECVACHGHSTMGLTKRGKNAPGDCLECHYNVSGAEAFNETYGVYPVTVYGHTDRKNSSAYLNCTVCHGHNPVNMTNLGWAESDCRGCHINETAGPTYWQPPIDAEKIPQDFGHAKMHCKWCHGHRPSGMTYVGIEDCTTCHTSSHPYISSYSSNASQWNDDSCYNCHINVTGTNKTDKERYNLVHQEGSDCKGCHLNASGANISIPDWGRDKLYNCTSCHNGTGGMSTRNATTWYAPQVSLNESTTHGNSTYKLSCTSCHTPHTNPDMLENTSCSGSCHTGEQDAAHTRQVNCTYCHMNSSVTVTVYNLGSNATAAVTPTQVEGVHSPAFDNNTNASSHSCTWCHFRLNNFTATNRTEDGENISIYPNIHNIYVPSRCQECHSEPANHPVKGAAFDNKDLSGCLGCHGSVHNITKGAGGPDCGNTGCHDSLADSRGINWTSVQTGIHRNLNHNATNASNLSGGEVTKACWACHGDGTNSSGDHATGPKGTSVMNPYTCNDCHVYGGAAYNRYRPTIYENPKVNVSEHLPSTYLSTADIRTNSTGTGDCKDCHKNDVDEKANDTQQGIGGARPVMANVSHYGQNDSLMTPTINSTNCTYCHFSTDSALRERWGNASYIGPAHNGADGSNLSLCDGCHNNSGAASLHDPVLDMAGSGSNCTTSCHNSVSFSRFINMTALNLSVHANLNGGGKRACWACHGNGSDPGGHPSNYKNPWNCSDCHGPDAGNYSAPVIYQHIPGGSISTGVPCASCHVRSVGESGDSSIPNAKANVSHYGTKVNLLINGSPSTDCTACHKDSLSTAQQWNADAKWLPNTDHIDTGNDASVCWRCHGIPASTFHDQGIRSISWYDGCTQAGCHA
jgi:hypothetical protein